MKIYSLMDNSNTCLLLSGRKISNYLSFFGKNFLEYENQSKNIVLEKVPYI